MYMRCGYDRTIQKKQVLQEDTRKYEILSVVRNLSGNRNWVKLFQRDIVMQYEKNVYIM